MHTGKAMKALISFGVGLLFFVAMLGRSDPAEAWTLEEAAAPYKGAEIRVVCDGYSACLAYQKMAEQFVEKSGINVVFEVSDLMAVQQKILADVLTESGAYDVVQISSWSLGAWAAQGFALPMKQFMNNPKLRDPTLNPDELVRKNLKLVAAYKGELYGLPFNFIPPFGIYRQDIAADPEEQAAFKAKYGYDMPVKGEKLVVIDTWQQWYDLIEFFTRKKGETLAGQTLENDFFGIIGAYKRHPTIVFDYERIVVGMGGELVNSDGRPMFDTPEARRALEYFLSWRSFSPPAHLQYTWDNQYSDFCTGFAFSTFSWGDTTSFLESAADCPASAGNIGYFVHPGTHITPAEGHVWAVPKTSQNPEAAYLFIQYLASKEVQKECQALGCVTFHKDVIFMTDWDDEGRMLIKRQLMENNWLYVRPSLPGLLPLQDIIAEELSAVAAGYQDVKTTLSNMQERASEVLSAE